MPSKRPWFDLPQLGPAGSWRDIGIAVGRGALVVGFLVLMYSIVPVDGFNDERAVAAWVRLVAVGLAFLLVLGV